MVSQSPVILERIKRLAVLDVAAPEDTRARFGGNAAMVAFRTLLRTLREVEEVDRVNA